MRVLSMSRLNRLLRIYKLVCRVRLCISIGVAFECRVSNELLYLSLHPLSLQPLAFKYLESQIGRDVGTIT